MAELERERDAARQERKEREAREAREAEHRAQLEAELQRVRAAEAARVAEHEEKANVLAAELSRQKDEKARLEALLQDSERAKRELDEARLELARKHAGERVAVDVHSREPREPAKLSWYRAREAVAV